MNHSTRKRIPAPKGQGALEYLLLIGGAVLIATIVLLIIISSTGSTNNIIGDNLNTFQHKISLGPGGGGGGGSLCVGGAPDGTRTGAEECDTADFGSETCATQLGAGYTGNLSCNTNCQIVTSACVPPAATDSIYLQAESGVLGAGLQIATQGVNTFLETNASCSATPTNEATYAITLNNSGPPNDQYAAWARIRSLDTGTYLIRLGIDPTLQAFTSPAGPTPGFAWYPLSTGALTGPSGNQTGRIRIPCQGSPAAGNGLMRVDQILFTNDFSCDPNVTTC